MAELERRALSTALSADGEKGVGGTAIVYDERTAIGDPKSWGFFEEIAPGAARKTLQESDVVALFNHNDDMPLARKSAGTLALEERSGGLDFDIPALPQTSYAADLRENVRNGNIQGVSFAFSVPKGKDTWTTLEDGSDLRRIHELQLREVSPVTFPAYPTTDIGLRSSVEAIKEAAKDRFPYWLRADKYKQADRDKMAKSGEAMPDGSYPIADRDDLENAIHAVGRGDASHNAIRRHIIERAKALGLSSLVPEDWNADGSVKEQNSRPRRDLEQRALAIIGELQELLGALAATDAGGASDDNDGDDDDYNGQHPTDGNDVNAGPAHSSTEPGRSTTTKPARTTWYDSEHLSRRQRALAARTGLTRPEGT